MIHRFRDFHFDSSTGRLERDGVPCSLRPRSAALLADLVTHRARWVAVPELLARVWADARVTRSSVSTEVAVLRREIGDDGRDARVIRSDRRRGYRFAPGVASRRLDTTGGSAGRSREIVCDAPCRLDSEAHDRTERGMEVAAHSFGRAAARGPRHLEVVGPGAGPFARGWTEAASGHGWRVHVGQRTDEACPPLWPWWQIARDLAERAEEPDHRATFARLVRDIERIATSRHPPSTPVEHQRRFALLDGMSRALIGAARHRATAILLLFAREADADSDRLLSFLLGRCLDLGGVAPLWIVTAAERTPSTCTCDAHARDRVVVGGAVPAGRRP